MRGWALQNFNILSSNFIRSLKYWTTQSNHLTILFSEVAASGDISRSPIDTCWVLVVFIPPPTESEIALDGKEWQKLPLFCYVNVSVVDFSYHHRSAASATPAATPATTGDQTGQNDQPIGCNKGRGKVKDRFWLAREPGG